MWRRGRVQAAPFRCLRRLLPFLCGPDRAPYRGPVPSAHRVCSDPAVYPDGRVCISILHAPGDDPMGYESSAERWSPVQSVEKILLSVVSMLAGNARPAGSWHTAGSRPEGETRHSVLLLFPR